MEKITIRPYEKGDEVSINDGFNEVFHLKRPIEEWYWKFNHEEYGSLIMVAVDDKNRILAHFATTLVDIKFNSRVYSCGQGVDVYATKQTGSVQHRLFIKTGREFLNTYGHRDKIIQLSAGFPSARALKLEKIKFNYCEGVPVEVGKKTIKNRKLIFKKTPKQSECNLHAAEELWSRSSHRYPVSLERDAKYIKRRYLDRPHNKYFYLTIEEEQQAKVFSVFEYNKYSIKWIDLIWDGDDKEHLIAMDNLVEDITRSAGVGSNEMWIANDSEAKDIFIQRGWEFSPHSDLFLTALSFHQDIDADKFVSELYFTMGDSDLV